MRTAANPLHDPANYSVHGLHIGLGATLLAEYFCRLQCGIFGPNRAPGRAFTDAVWIEAGYALDAPQVMPAGGMTSFTLPDMPDAMPEQMLADREPDHANR